MGSHARSRAERWLTHRATVPAIFVLTLLVTLPSLSGGFYSDDYALRAALHGKLPYSPPWYDLYNFAPGTIDANRATMNAGVLPWFTAPEFDLHLVRPVA